VLGVGVSVAAMARNGGGWEVVIYSIYSVYIIIPIGIQHISIRR